MLHADNSSAEVVVLVPSTLDLSASKQVADVLADVCATPYAQVVVDLSRVTACDAVALRVLLEAADRAGESCSVALHRPPQMLQQLAQLLGLSGRLEASEA